MVVMVVDGGSSWEGPQSTAFATKSALHLCNLYFKHLPQKLHFTVLKVPHRPRNLHFKVHELLHLPRNLHFKVHKVMHLPQKLLPHLPHDATKCHEICSSRSTKYCTCHEICTSRSTKYCARHNFRKRTTCAKVTIHRTCHKIRARRRLPPCPKCCACHEIYTSK